MLHGMDFFKVSVSDQTMFKGKVDFFKAFIFEFVSLLNALLKDSNVSVEEIQIYFSNSEGVISYYEEEKN